MFHKFSSCICACALLAAACLPVAGAFAQTGVPDENGIIWYTPVTADDNGRVVYEERTDESATQRPTENLPQVCSVEDSPFMVAWLASGAHHVASADTHPRVVIVIDDMGVDKKRSARMARLAATLTLSFLPYAHNVQEQVDAAAAMGHEIMMHVPMMPESDTIDPGPNVLRGDIAASELQSRILANLDAFHGYDGINNHMGSRFTQDRAGLEELMSDLRTRGVFFLDSRTHPASIAEKMAAEAGVPTAHRDVFLDHVETPAAVAKSLALLEKDARRHGVAIAIGHPKDVTIEALAAWLPTLRAKGIDVVSLGTIIRERQRNTLKMLSQAPSMVKGDAKTHVQPAAATAVTP